jgi:hypothetical protein
MYITISRLLSLCWASTFQSISPILFPEDPF